MKGNRRGLQYMVLILLVLGGIYIYTEVKENVMTKPPVLKVYQSDELQREAILGTYKWKSMGRAVIADSDHPANFSYQEDSSISASSGQKIYFSPLVESTKVPYEIQAVMVSESQKPETTKELDFVIHGDAAVVTVPEGSGRYVFSIVVDYEGKGDAVYGVEVLVDVWGFDVENLIALKTPYIGNASRISEIARVLPVPGSGYVQRYISLETEVEPYGITLYYEPKEELKNLLVYPQSSPENTEYQRMEKNALALFALVENAGKVTFKVKNEQSKGSLDQNSYDSSHQFTREDLTEKFGPLDDILSHPELFED